MEWHPRASLVQRVATGGALLALAGSALADGETTQPPPSASADPIVFGSSGSTDQVATGTAMAPAPSYRHRMLLLNEWSLLDAGQMIANGPYSGLEGNRFALRLSGGLLGLNLALPRLLSAAIGDPVLPGTEPGVGGDRDDPKRDYLRWRVGKDGDALHLELGLLSTTLGHGSSVRLYQNTPQGAPLAIGLAAEGQLNGGGAVLLLGDVFRPQRFVAGRLRVKPLNVLLSPDSALQPEGLDIDPRGELLGLLIIGASAAVDFEAPVTDAALDADGNQVPGRAARPVGAFGVDVEMPPIDLWLLHVNPYLDGVMLMGRGDGPGFGVHPGIALGTDAIGLFWQLGFQYFFGTTGYKPWYFDTRYAFERTRTVADGAPKASQLSPAVASHGYTGSLSAQLAETITAWVETGDQIPFDLSSHPNYGRFRLGATAGPSMANVTVSFAREGWRDYGRLFSEDGLSALVVQGKLSLAVVALVARYSYSVERNIDTGERFRDQGFDVGTELGFSF
ncbi:MAG: hypothetical protein JXR83_17245 [Deltaproteobacteria bacterium]|nr:hypothetical protein [Deltaproteobacteria bacterium]